MCVILVPSVIEIHRTSTAKPLRLCAAIAVLAAARYGRKLVSLCLEIAPTARAQRETHSANSWLEGTIAVWTGTLLGRVHITVHIMIRIAVWMKVDLRGSHVTPISGESPCRGQGEIQQAQSHQFSQRLLCWLSLSFPRRQ